MAFMCNSEEFSYVTFELIPRVLTNLLARFVNCSLGRCKSNCVCQNLLIFISLVLNNFMQYLFTTKSTECKSDLYYINIANNKYTYNMNFKKNKQHYVPSDLTKIH